MVWYRFEKKQTTDDLLRLSIGWLKKHNYLRENAIINGKLIWSRTYGEGNTREIGSLFCTSYFIGEKRSLTLAYRYGGKEDINLNIPIDCSSPYYGGKRYWFLCPKCGKRVAFLYGGKYFWCRCCHNLSYPTQQMSFMSRMLEKSKKCEARVSEDGFKKRWLHWSTFEKYMDKSEHYERLSLVALYRTLRKMV